MKATLEVDVSKEAYQEAAALALKSADESYSPYTRCPAGVAIISDKGVHSGGIVENAAHNPTLQPLQAAFINARFEGLTEYNTVRSPNPAVNFRRHAASISIQATNDSLVSLRDMLLRVEK